MNVIVTIKFQTSGNSPIGTDLGMIGNAMNEFADNLRDRGDDPCRQTLSMHCQIRLNESAEDDD